MTRGAGGGVRHGVASARTPHPAARLHIPRLHRPLIRSLSSTSSRPAAPPAVGAHRLPAARRNSASVASTAGAFNLARFGTPAPVERPRPQGVLDDELPRRATIRGDDQCHGASVRIGRIREAHDYRARRILHDPVSLAFGESASACARTPLSAPRRCRVRAPARHWCCVMAREAGEDGEQRNGTAHRGLGREVRCGGSPSPATGPAFRGATGRGPRADTMITAGSSRASRGQSR